MNKPTRPQPPPVYRPQPTPKVLQPKAAAPQAGKTPAAPPVYRPQPVPKVLQAKMAAQPSKGVIQLNGKKRWGNAESNWNKFVKYDTNAAQDIERGILNIVLNPNKVASKIINLMLEWKFDELTIGHASQNKSKKKNQNTDPACETIRVAFNNYISNHS
ncbi:MAG: hypothetical protein M3444_00565 [Acidobacteriota bacterium]|nr:hypothetical protein [Acidobacteriota bacterium]MDQ5835973.1 hypothetical protein [Acidobacteriota bacterium]